MKNFLFTEYSDDQVCLLFILKQFHAKFFNFSTDESLPEQQTMTHHEKFLVYHTNEILLNEHSIESFSYLLAIDSLFSFIDFEKEVENGTMRLIINNSNAYVNRASSSVLFYDHIVSHLNFVCSCYTRNEESSAVGLPPLDMRNALNRKKAVDLLFKFLIYFYSFLDQMSGVEGLSEGTLSHRIVAFLNSNQSNRMHSIDKQVVAAKQKIFHLLTWPLSLKFNNSPVASPTGNFR
jgi:hypothetical protein